MFVLPYLDSIAGFTFLFMAVHALSSWIATSSPRLSYLGVQLALAFYLINLQEFTIQISLSIARDRVFGVLLGLMSMWLIYDRLWQKNALDEMQRLFARNLEMFAGADRAVVGERPGKSHQAHSPVARSAQRRVSGSEHARRRGPLRVRPFASAKAANS